MIGRRAYETEPTLDWVLQKVGGQVYQWVSQQILSRERETRKRLELTWCRKNRHSI